MDQIPGRYTRRRVFIKDVDGPVIGQDESSILSERGLEQDSVLLLGHCGSCGLAFHSEAEALARCAFCPHVLCGSCATRRCEVCSRIGCHECVIKTGDVVICKRHLYSKAMVVATLLVATIAFVVFLLSQV